MKQKIIRKLLSSILISVLTVSLLSSCGQKSQEESVSSDAVTTSQSSETTGTQTVSSSAAESSSNPEAGDGFVHDPILNELGVEPYVKEPVTITIGIKQNANVLDYDNNHMTNMLEEITGINIEFMLFPSGDAQDKLQMMVTGGETLPDIIFWGQKDALAQQWGAEGYIVPLEDYFANSSIYMSEGIATLQELRGFDVLDQKTDPDGHVWQTFEFFESSIGPVDRRLWIYEPWLTALNLEVPTTTEEFEEMLRAFKTQDPNGNGKNDEIPMLGHAPAQGGIFYEYIMNAFTHTTGTVNFLCSENGQLSLSYTKDGWKEGIKYIRGLVEEGLIDPVSFTQDSQAFKQAINTSGDQIVGCYVHSSNSFINKDHPSKQQWVLAPPLAGPDGYVSTSYNVIRPNAIASITSDCEHPEVAFRLLDTMWREEISITNRHGKQGENWDYVANIKDDPKFADLNFDVSFMGDTPYIHEYNSCWNQPQNNDWNCSSPNLMLSEWRNGMWALSADFETNRLYYEYANKLDAYYAVVPSEPITVIKYASSELTAESDILAEELKSYMFEKLSNWCVGVGDVEKEWDAYLAELEAIGVSRFLEIQQAGWNN